MPFNCKQTISSLLVNISILLSKYKNAFCGTSKMLLLWLNKIQPNDQNYSSSSGHLRLVSRASVSQLLGFST